MTVVELTDFFQWMTIINLGLFFFTFIVLYIFKKPIASIHAKSFGIGEERVKEMLYSLFGIYKIIIIVFVVIPYIVLGIIQ